ncbi:MAG: ribonuclease PH [Nitrospinota bacterium]
MRADGRLPRDLREVRLHPDFITSALGSTLIEVGNTRVICTATIEDRVPPHCKDTGSGWITAEYSMLPAAGGARAPRERGRASGRTMEIQRLIGRSMRSVADLSLLGERTLWLDCDVIQADGGTRTAAITGGYVALALACRKLMQMKVLGQTPLKDFIAAVSVGFLGEVPLLDLDYEEDAAAAVDMNVVMTGDGRLVEVQGTGEGRPFTREEMEVLLSLAQKGIRELIEMQRSLLSED